MGFFNSGNMWDMFSSTGNIEYYMFYRALSDRKKEVEGEEGDGEEDFPP